MMSIRVRTSPQIFRTPAPSFALHERRSLPSASASRREAKPADVLERPAAKTQNGLGLRQSPPAEANRFSTIASDLKYAIGRRNYAPVKIEDGRYHLAKYEMDADGAEHVHLAMTVPFTGAHHGRKLTRASDNNWVAASEGPGGNPSVSLTFEDGYGVGHVRLKAEVGQRVPKPLPRTIDALGAHNYIKTQERVNVFQQSTPTGDHWADAQATKYTGPEGKDGKRDQVYVWKDPSDGTVHIQGGPFFQSSANRFQGGRPGYGTPWKSAGTPPPPEGGRPIQINADLPKDTVLGIFPGDRLMY